MVQVETHTSLGLLDSSGIIVLATESSKEVYGPGAQLRLWIPANSHGITLLVTIRPDTIIGLLRKQLPKTSGKPKLCAEVSKDSRKARIGNRLWENI